MLDEIFSRDKRLAVANRALLSRFPQNGSVHSFVDEYLQHYARVNGLSIDDVLARYTDFAKVYSRHLDIFHETQQYPCEYRDDTAMDRITYDIALILSCVSSFPRYQILDNLTDFIKKLDAKNIAVIGAGAGIELALIKKFSARSRTTAYDLVFNNFLRESFPLATLREENFMQAIVAQGFDVIFAIELLEHIEDYEKFLLKAFATLKKNGLLVCTTATNMPQFDHVHNFRDIASFKRLLNKIGFNITEHRQFSQHHVFHDIEASNDWFVLEK